MPSLPIFQVDAFADRPFTGNPAAVCPLQTPLPDALMQNIAAENNLSETAFFHPQGDGVFALRWFTPTVEVELCGHATLASAFVLMTALEPARTEVVFNTRSGLLTVNRSGHLYQLDFPLQAPVGVAEVTTPVADALGASPIEIVRARSWLALFSSADQIRRLAPDMAALARLGTAVCVTAPADQENPGVDFVCRYFAPGFGVPEDPVTGSAYCMLAPYWAARLGKSRLRARQLSRRGGEVLCESRGARVLISGAARLVLTGQFHY
jgi:PhzF family phenazine biosynthesis protein